VSNINTDNTNESLNEDLMDEEVVSSDNVPEDVDFLNENDGSVLDTQVDTGTDVDSLSSPDSPDKLSTESDSNLNWYIVQTLSNYEKRVQTRVQQIIDEEKYKGKLFRVLVPMQQTVEVKNNKRQEKETKIFPGYVFIQMDIEDEIAYELRQIPGIAKFVGVGNKPSPVVEDEILKVLRKIGDTTKEIDVDFEVGEVIKVVDGPFRGYTGSISEINPLKGNIKAKISIFGRETPVELDFEQVEKTV
jgi:transcriptional antiterminator NusG